MNYFAGDRFTLFSDSARALYAGCRDIPIFDYHNHLSPQLLYENRNFENLAQFWLTGDHYIWRAMRAAGVDERLITGDAPDYERYLAWVAVLDQLVGCPLYAWTQMQVARLFGEEEPLTLESAPAFYERGNALLQTEDFRPRALLKRFGVTKLCTTDEPGDTLAWHIRLRDEVKDLTVLPAFRPDKLLNASKATWLPAMEKLSKQEGMAIGTLDELKAALVHSLDHFAALGCCTSDHGYEGLRYGDPSGAEEAFVSALARGIATAEEEEHIASELLRFLGREYHRRGMVMQLHVGALRNGNTRRFRALGADCGVDSVDDPIGVRAIAPLLDELETADALPRTILYCLNETEYAPLCTLAVSFAGGGVRDRVQVGSAWWFNDHERGMRLQLHQLMENAMLPGFVGMLTDSRSLGTFVRHDYFRRILCDCVGEYVERGEFPLKRAQQIVDDICYQNAITYFGG
ncbi:MAG: glucuronate isomerase [Ruminococcaceae bacterium]|nr:glucuronate isomerase [Oscillospiraceae bacterium]